MASFISVASSRFICTFGVSTGFKSFRLRGGKGASLRLPALSGVPVGSFGGTVSVACGPCSASERKMAMFWMYVCQH